MSRGAHRRPRRPVRDFLFGIWLLVTVSRYCRKRARRVPPPEIRRAGLAMADVIAAATSNYPITQPCPWGMSAGACLMWHPVDHEPLYQVVEA